MTARAEGAAIDRWKLGLGWGSGLLSANPGSLDVLPTDGLMPAFCLAVRSRGARAGLARQTVGARKITGIDGMMHGM
jgi:hypothetical protein